MVLDAFQGCKDKTKLKWWYSLAFDEGDMYPHT